MKKFTAVLLIGLILSASAEAQTVSAEPQILRLDVGLLPEGSAYFYCDVLNPPLAVTFVSHNIVVTGFTDKKDGGTEGGLTFDENNASVLNQVYFTANSGPFTGTMPYIEVAYLGSKNDVVCYYGKGNRTVEFTGK